MGNELDANIVIRFFFSENLSSVGLWSGETLFEYSFYEIQFFEDFILKYDDTEEVC